VPFNDNSVGPKKKVGLKINSNNSVIKPVHAEVEKTTQLSQNLQNIIDNILEKCKSSALEFKKMCLDKTLPETKLKIEEEKETAFITSLIKLASDYNIYSLNDETGTSDVLGGSNYINTLLLKNIRWQRDRINVLEHKLEKLSNAFDKLVTDSIKK